ncbi:MAG: hypothetical protein GC149_20435 [Gammaproteobacteria bacterium]|nr:hypothetical protein [Gammaproteobacteria bacterium]
MMFPAGDFKFDEFSLQCAVATYLDGLAAATKRLAWSHPPNEGKQKPQYRMKQIKAGMKTGEPDCIIYLKGGKTIFIELKTDRGSLSAAQKKRHAELRALGFDVYTVKAATPAEAVRKVARILFEHGIREAR